MGSLFTKGEDMDVELIKGFKLEATRGAFEVLLRNTLMLLRRLEVLGTTCKTLHIASKGTRKTRIVAPLLGITQLLKSCGSLFKASFNLPMKGFLSQISISTGLIF